MLNENKINIDQKSFLGNLVFEKKENSGEEHKSLTLQERMVNHSKNALGIKVISVALPSNYNPKLRGKKQFTSWLKTIKKKSNKPLNFKTMETTSEKTKTTKSNQVKEHLIQKGMISSWTAIELYGATRLSAIIFNLRRRGMNIHSQPLSSLDRNNNICNFVNYVLVE